MDFFPDSTVSLLISQMSPVTLWIAGFIAIASIVFLGYLSYTPRVDKRAPAFTSDTTLFIGSWSYFKRRWSFWVNSVAQSKTGHFSFWLGKHHCVGVSGEAARKWFLDNRHFHRINAAVLHGVGPEITPPIHQIFQMNGPNGHSYFQRRVLDLMKPEHLTKCLPRVTRDARATFEALGKSKTSVINPIEDCYRLVLTQTSRIVFGDEISDTPDLLDTYLYYTKILQHISSGHTIARPWWPSIQHMKRLYCRNGLKKLVTPLVQNRSTNITPRADDALQYFIDNGDTDDQIITFLGAILFISIGNSGKLAGGLLNLMANHPDWQERIYNEIKASAKAHSTNPDAPLIDQLATLPFEAWENISAFLELCVTDSIRVHVAFPMTRQNIAPQALVIPGTNEVVPSGSFIVYNTGDAHFNKTLYPDPTRVDPERFNTSRREFKKESYSFLGWGNGRHRCVGSRWAKTQQSIVLAHALAVSRWIACDATGRPIELSDHQIDFDRHGTSLPKGIYLKAIPRE